MPAELATSGFYLASSQPERGRVTCEDGTGQTTIKDSAAGNATKIVTGVGHFGVASGHEKASGLVGVQDSGTDALIDNGIPMCLHIIYDCAGQRLECSADVLACSTLVGLARRQRTARDPDVTGPVAKYVRVLAT